jgi:hypothetical protein
MAADVLVAYFALGGSFVIVPALLLGLRRALERADWPARERAETLRTASVILVAWFGVALVLSWMEFFRGAPGRIPAVELGIFIPFIVGRIALWRATRLTRIIDIVPQSWLVGVQVYRIVGLVFVVLWGFGKLPGSFALPAGLGDFLVGILAPVVAVLYARGVPRKASLVRTWNVLGILDLVVAVTTGFLTSPSPIQMLALETPNVLISAFPLVMIPVFAVPVSILLHLASLTKLQRAPYITPVWRNAAIRSAP